MIRMFIRKVKLQHWRGVQGFFPREGARNGALRRLVPFEQQADMTFRARRRLRQAKPNNGAAAPLFVGPRDRADLTQA